MPTLYIGVHLAEKRKERRLIVVPGCFQPGSLNSPILETAKTVKTYTDLGAKSEYRLTVSKASSPIPETAIIGDG